MQNLLPLKPLSIRKAVLVILSAFFVISSLSEVRAIVPELYNTENSKQQFEQINPYNGHLSFTVPVGTLGARGDLTFTPSISIETLWETNWFSYPDSTGGNNDVSYVSPPFETSYYHTFLGYMTQDSGGGQISFCNPQHPNAGDVDYNRTHTRITFHAPDGSSIHLKDVMNNGAVLNHQACSTYRPSRGTIFVGEEDAGITFVSDNEIFDTVRGSNDPPLSGTLYLKNGTRYRYNGSTMTIIDKNGNLMTDANTVSGQGYTVTDSAGRQLKYASQLPDPYDPQTFVLEYKSTGTNGQLRIVTVRHDFLHNRLRADYEQRAKYCSAELFPTIGCLGYLGQDEQHDPYVISKIELPGNKAFKFYYNHYGELARVEYPDGGAVEYEHFQVRPLLPGNWDTRIIHRAIQEKRVYPNGETGSNYETKTTYDYSYSDHTETTVTVTDSNGNFISKTKHYLFGEPYTDFSPSGRFGGEALYPYQYGLQAKEYKTEFFSSINTVQRTSEMDWRQADGSNSTTAILNSPRVVQTKVTLNDTGQTSQTNFEYDQYVNQTDIYEYDHDIVQPVRHTHTDYVTDSNYTSIAGGHLRSLPSATQVYGYQNGQPFLAAQSEVKYDETALMPRADVIGWNDPQRSTRGNPTKTRNWLKYENEPENWLEIKAEYDVLGNVVKTIDAKNYASLIDYTDRFGVPDNEARSSISPAELNSVNGQPQLHTFAFPTKTTNVSFNWDTYTQYDYYTGKIVNTEDIDGVIAKTIYNDSLDRPTQSFTAVGTTSEIQSKIVYDDSNHRIQTTSDLNRFNDNLIKSESFYDGMGRTVETHRYESNNGFTITKSIPFVMVRDPETSVWRAGTKVSNPYRPNETPVWTTSLSDSLGRATKTITPDGAIVKTEYSGNSVTVTDQSGKQRRSITNALGQLKRVDEPTDTDGLGTISNPNQPTYYAYDTLGKLTSVQQNGVNPAQCGVNISTCAQIRTFGYDSLSRLRSVTNPELGTTATNGTITYLYDANGNLTTKTDPRQVVATYAYDALNRVISRSYTAPANLANYQSTPNVAYTYDDPTIVHAKGKLTKVTASSGGATPFAAATEYQMFDQMGRVTQSRQTIDGVAYGMPQTYTYNLSGALIEEQYPSGRVVKNVLNGDGDLAIVESKKNSNFGYFNYAKSFIYTAAGAVSSLQLGNGKWESTVFNSRLQPTQIALGTTQNGTDKLKLNFDYGMTANNGNVLSQTITTPAETRDTTTYPAFVAAQNYTYDALNRLLSADERRAGYTQAQCDQNPGQCWKQTYKYDRYGNRRFDMTNGNTTTPTPTCVTAVCNPEIEVTKNQLVGAVYDAAGNTKTDASGKQFTYDAENHQTEVVQSGISLGRYFYNGDGKRVRKIALEATTNQLVTTEFIYDAGGKIVAEYANPIPTSAPQVSYLTSDHLGSPRINTDENGMVIARHDYQPFGEEVARTSYGTDTVRKQFTGYERDNEADLDFAQARYYNKNHGRFTSADEPFADQDETDPQTWNLYAYSKNNPLHFADPTGKGILDFFEKAFNYLLYGYAETNVQIEIRRQDSLEYLKNLESQYGGIFYFYQGIGYRKLDVNSLGTGGLIGWANFWRGLIDRGDISTLTADQRTNADNNPPITGVVAGIRGSPNPSSIPSPAPTSTASTNIVSRINSSPRLVREAERATRNQAVQREIDDIAAKLANGNMNPGKGNEFLFNGIYEARGANGGRVYFRNVGGTIEILAKSSKANQAQVINELKNLYGK